MELSVDEILQQKYSYKPYIFGGFTLPPYYSQYKTDIDNFEVFNTDVFVCSFHKAGTTWTQEMVWLIANNANFEAAKKELHFRSCYLEWSAVSGSNNEYPTFISDSVNFCKNLRDPRFLKTHLPLNLLPKQIKNGCKKPKIIYVTRNPKDVCTSLYHHEVLLSFFSGTFDEFCKVFLNNKVIYSPYFEHIKSFVTHQKELDILFIKYEDMKRDMVSVIKKVAQFLGVQLNNTQIEKLKDHLSFESMKKNPYVNNEKIIQSKGLKGSFMRSGVIGSYKNEMSEDLVEKFDAWINENFKGLEDYVHL